MATSFMDPSSSSVSRAFTLSATLATFVGNSARGAGSCGKVVGVLEKTTRGEGVVFRVFYCRVVF